MALGGRDIVYAHQGVVWPQFHRVRACRADGDKLKFSSPPFRQGGELLEIRVTETEYCRIGIGAK